MMIRQLTRFVTVGLSLLLVLLSWNDVSNNNMVMGETLSTGDDVDAFIDKQITENDVMVFGKSYCPYCRATYSLLEKLYEESGGDDAWKFHYINLDIQPEEDGPLIQMELLRKTGQKTVPNIFIEGKHIGGNSDLQELYQSGELQVRLSKIATNELKETYL